MHKNDDKLCARTADIDIDVTAMSLMMSNVEVDIIMGWTAPALPRRGSGRLGSEPTAALGHS